MILPSRTRASRVVVLVTAAVVVTAAVIVIALIGACGDDAGSDAGPSDAPPGVTEARFTGATAIKALRAKEGWMVVLETLQAQTLITVPDRRIVLLDEQLRPVTTIEAQEGWTLIDAAAHPSGAVSAISTRLSPGDPNLMRMQLSRCLPDGSRVDTELAPVSPGSNQQVFLGTVDRARIVAVGEDVVLAARWGGNAVYESRLSFAGDGFHETWATRVEANASLTVLGIIGGGFDNFHQGDSSFFVYTDVDEVGNAYVVVPSTQEVLQAHDAAFGEHLSDGADPDHFDFGAAILTKVDADGRRAYAKLLGAPGRETRLLNARFANGSVALVGRIKVGAEPESWDAWILSARAETGDVVFARSIDVQGGDMFWDAAPVPDHGLLAVGSTGYTQNPMGLSVSDEREALAVLLDPQGRVLERLELPRSTGGRGDEAISGHLDKGGILSIAGMLDGPGTHAEVRSDGFLELRVTLSAAPPL